MRDTDTAIVERIITAILLFLIKIEMKSTKVYVSELNQEYLVSYNCGINRKCFDFCEN